MGGKFCSTCGTHVAAKGNFVEFDCPGCGNTRIVRCDTCKVRSNRYKCAECDFEGP